jgi:hypothetical protein
MQQECNTRPNQKRYQQATREKTTLKQPYLDPPSDEKGVVHQVRSRIQQTGQIGPCCRAHTAHHVSDGRGCGALVCVHDALRKEMDELGLVPR